MVRTFLFLGCTNFWRSLYSGSLFNGSVYMHKVDDSMELDVDKFEKSMLGLFPVVKPSDWMNFLGPVFLFFNEAIEEMSGRNLTLIPRAVK